MNDLSIFGYDSGASSLAGVAVIIMMMPVTKSVAQWMGGLQRKLMTSKDNRVEVNRFVCCALCLGTSSISVLDEVCLVAS